MLACFARKMDVFCSLRKDGKRGDFNGRVWAGQGRAQGSEKGRKVGNGKWVIETSDDGAGGHTTFRELVPGHCGCRSPGLLWPVRGEPACSEYR
jgi:hypothetical protein